MQNKTPNLVTAIRFYDEGQDVLRFYVNSAGKVLDCQPFHGSIYVGCYVLEHEKLRAGSKVDIVHNGEVYTMNFRVENTSLLGEQESKEVYHYYEQWIKRINDLRSI